MAGRKAKDDEWPGWDAGKEPKTEPEKVVETGGAERRRTAAALEPEPRSRPESKQPEPEPKVKSKAKSKASKEPVTLRCYREGGAVEDVATDAGELADDDGVAVPLYTMRVQVVQPE